MPASGSLVPLLTADDVGRIIGRHPKNVLLLFRRGELPGIKLGNRSVRFDPSDVSAYIDSHRATVPA